MKIGLTSLKILSIFGLLVSCSQQDESVHGYFNNLSDNELLFDVYAKVIPESSQIQLKDTLWVSIHQDDSVLTENISGETVTLPISQSRFLVQVEIVDLIEDKPATFRSFTKNGSIVEVKDGLLTARFGHPDSQAYLDLGFLFDDLGNYALIFHNYPNPNLENSDEICNGDTCPNIWYDLLFYEEKYSHELLYDAFVVYRFEKGQIISADQTLHKYIDISTYDDSIYEIEVR